MSKKERILYTSLIVLIIFTFGIQIGIYQGRELQKIENIRIQRMQEYLFKRCAINDY